MISKKIFTKEELSKYDGKDGKDSYVAVDGVVYDVSNVFYKGDHYSHIAGQDLTDDFYLQHAVDEIKKYPVVGTLE